MAEGGSASIPVTLSKASTTDTKLTFTFTNGTAGSADYTTTDVQITIPAGQTTGSVSVPTTDDNVYEGDETFTVSVKSVDGGTVGDITDQATVTIIDNEHPPVANPDVVTTNEDERIQIMIVSNDTDADGTLDVKSIDLDSTVDGIQHAITTSEGVWNVDSTGILTFQPNKDFNGKAFLTYNLSDNVGLLSNTTSITVNVLPINDSPIARNNTQTINEDEQAFGNLITDSEADSDIEGDPLIIASILIERNGSQYKYSVSDSIRLSSEGVLFVEPDGSYTFIPEPNFNGTIDGIEYVLSDGILKDTAKLIIYITPINDEPIAMNDEYNLNVNQSQKLQICFNDLFSGDGGNHIEIYTSPFYGNVEVNTDSTITFTPKLNMVGDVTFMYKIIDQDGDESMATVLIHLSANDVSIPQGFSPNGDGKNDEFRIDGLDKYPSNKIVIINRWDHKVYEARPYLNDWNGECSSSLVVGDPVLPTGTYFYILDLGDGTPAKKGYIYLKR